MIFDHSLHPSVLDQPEHQAEALAALSEHAAQLTSAAPKAAAVAANQVQIPLTTVSSLGNFDATIFIRFRGMPSAANPVPLMVDSGNTVLIVPSWESIAALPNAAATYQVLGQAQAPFGCPANVVRGPIDLVTSTGAPFTLANCVFYACTANNSDGKRTANFGAGNISPWSASGWNTPQNLGVTVRSPLAYSSLPYAVIDYAAATTVVNPSQAPTVAGGSSLTLYATRPTGFRMFDILRNRFIMSVKARSLTIGTTKTAWPGALPSPIAMVDTGGGPVLLSDPNQAISTTPWPPAAQNPDWTNDGQSIACESTAAALTVELGDSEVSYSYRIDPARLPPLDNRPTLVMCRQNEFLRGMNGMNIGGISALMNSILIDYANTQVGFKPK
ncbi:MAG TPA: hypothetical protein VMI56_10945 [Reyranella sp.]|nr:hypothetical protein [Reyranella sp.]